ncbi:MAG TPA: hypothetical protein V6D18_04130 [Thermosynechococcaceae cyanobacterium]
MTKVPLLGRLFMVLDTLGLNFAWQSLRTGNIEEILQFGDCLAALSLDARAQRRSAI